MRSRKSWNQYFMRITMQTANRSSCLSAPKGAIIVTNDGCIVSTGYSGAPRGIKSCYDKGACRKRSLGFGHGKGHHVCLAVHAEANAILNASRNGINIQGSKLYCTHYPCENCAKLIINAGIREVFYAEPYKNDFAWELFDEAGIKLTRIIVGEEND